MFKHSKNVNLETPEWEDALRFYTEIMGLKVVERMEDSVQLDAGNINLFISKGEKLGPITEYYVEDLSEARTYLEENGCRVVLWEGKGKPCYIEDPFGFVFNLWEKSPTS